MNMNTDNNESIAERIKRYRKIKKISQEDLSNLSGINVSTIKKYECGLRNPKPDQLLKIASALGVSINAFLTFDINTISDVIFLLIQLDEQTDLKLNANKDANGNIIPNSISLSFNNEQINNAIASYIKYKENTPSSNPDSESFCSDNSLQPIACDDYRTNVNGIDILVENTKDQLIMSDEEIKN